MSSDASQRRATGGLLPLSISRRPANREAGSGRSTELTHVPLASGSAFSLPATSRTYGCVSRATFWAAVTHLSTTALVFAALAVALAYVDAIRMVYLCMSVIACVIGEAAISALWLPIGFFSAATLLSCYLFQMSFSAAWLSAETKIWIGLAAQQDYTQNGALFAVGLPVLMQLLALFQRQSSLAHRHAAWRATMLAAASSISAPAGVGSSMASPAAASAAASSSASPSPPPSGRVAGRIAAAAAAANLRHRLLRAWGAIIEPFALFVVMCAACIRLNFWAFCYVIAVGVVRYTHWGPHTLPFHWFLMRVLIATAIVVQYFAILSLPLAVWQELGASSVRPWLDFGEGWALADQECERLGLSGSNATGIVCYVSATGELQPWFLFADFLGLMACVLVQANHTALHAVRRTDLTVDGGLPSPANGSNGSAEVAPTQPSPQPADLTSRQTPSGLPLAGASSVGVHGVGALPGALPGAPPRVSDRSEGEAEESQKMPPQTWTAYWTGLLTDLEIWTLRIGHLVVLFVIVMIAMSPNYNSTQGAISLCFTTSALFYVGFERRLE